MNANPDALSIALRIPPVRNAEFGDLEAIRHIYNAGIEDRTATLEEDPKDCDAIAAWWSEHEGRYPVLVALDDAKTVVGWASLNPYGHRCSYRGVADLSIYVARSARGTGIGSTLLPALEKCAKRHAFHKIVLFALPSNLRGLALYRKFGYRDVGVFREHGRLDGTLVDVLAMEKILRPSILFVCRHNTGRSQMAEAYLRHLAGDIVDVASAGTIAAEIPDPGVVAVMAEDGIDLRAARPKLIDAELLSRADRIITMGCDVEGIGPVDDDWGLPDPKGQPLERVREIRERVKSEVYALAAILAS